MPVLVPGIYAYGRSSWMPGPSPATTT